MLGYAQTFKAGDDVVIRMTAEGLAAGRDREYPLRDYHGKTVMVVAQRDKKGSVTREIFPDEHGMVDVVLPFPFIHPKGGAVSQIPVLYSALSRG